MNNLEKDCTLYPEAVELKQLGFDEPCLRYIYTGDTANNGNVPCAVLPSKAENFNEDDLCVSTPTFSQAFRWFREKGLDVKVEREDKGFYIGFYWTGVAWVPVGSGTFEEAELDCLRHLIRIFKHK